VLLCGTLPTKRFFLLFFPPHSQQQEYIIRRWSWKIASSAYFPSTRCSEQRQLVYLLAADQRRYWKVPFNPATSSWDFPGKLLAVNPSTRTDQLLHKSMGNGGDHFPQAADGDLIVFDGVYGLNMSWNPHPNQVIAVMRCAHIWLANNSPPSSTYKHSHGSPTRSTYKHSHGSPTFAPIISERPLAELPSPLCTCFATCPYHTSDRYKFTALAATFCVSLHSSGVSSRCAENHRVQEERGQARRGEGGRVGVASQPVGGLECY
jgi:hypothetical protein